MLQGCTEPTANYNLTMEKFIPTVDICIFRVVIGQLFARRLSKTSKVAGRAYRCSVQP